MQYEIYQEKNIRINRKEIDKIIKKFVKLFKISNSVSLSIAFISPEQIKRLNYQYRKINQVTDVLSFGGLYQENKKAKSLSRAIPREQKNKILRNENFLGEIIICYNQAVKQAKEGNRKVTKEINQLLAHGLVHLMGYDHETTKELGEMREIEKEILF